MPVKPDKESTPIAAHGIVLQNSLRLMLQDRCSIFLGLLIVSSLFFGPNLSQYSQKIAT
jgi:hypothetical protein